MPDDLRSAGSFGIVAGDRAATETIEKAWDVYAGARTDNTLAKLIARDSVHDRRYFVNDNYWWVYTDSQCNFHATYGWRPFFDNSYRRVDHDTWVRFFECQVDPALHEAFLKQSTLGKAPPVGFFPHSMFPERTAEESLTMFYSNSFEPGDEAHERHDEAVDYQLMNIITASDWVLFERDFGAAHRILDQVERFMSALEARMDPDGLVLVGPQGGQAEFGHGGWRYPSLTHVYLAKVCRNMVEVAAMVEVADGDRAGGDYANGGAEAGADQARGCTCNGDRSGATDRTPGFRVGGDAGRADAVGLRQRWEEREKCASAALDRFLVDGKWFASALDRTKAALLGTGLVDSSPSSYFETYPNLNSIVLGVAGPELAGSILDRIDAIPQLAENVLVLNNYPERPRSEMDDDHGGFPGPGVHMNGGSWWMLATSLLYARAATGRSSTLPYLRDLLDLHARHMTIDCYYDWGHDPASQFTDKGNGDPGHYSIGAAGSFGAFFRGILRAQPLRDGIRISPVLPSGISRLKTTAPVRYGGKELLFDIVDSGRSNADRMREPRELHLKIAELPAAGTFAAEC